MQTQSPTRPRGHFGITFLLALAIIVVLQGAIFLSILDKTVGTNWVSMFRQLTGQSQVSLGYTPRVALLKSTANARLSGLNSEAYYNLGEQWEVALNQAGIRYRVISDADLATRLSAPVDVVVLPSAICLSDQQRSNIGALLEAGTGLVASGAMGVRDENCAWKGWEFLTATVGVEKPSAEKIPQSSFAAFRGGQFYSELVPAGYRLTVPPQELVLGESSAPDVFLSDDRMHPAHGESMGSATLAVHGQHGKGRFVWFGFKETLPNSSGAETRGFLNEFLASTVRWTGREPMPVFGNWPKNAQAAVMVGEEALNARDAQPAADVLRDAQIPATFFLSAPGTAADPGSYRGFGAAAEIATAGDNDQAFADQNAVTQTERLNNARAALERGGAKSIAGFYPPQDAWDGITVASLKKTGYSYYLDRAAFQRAVPELLDTPNQSLFQAPEADLTRISSTAADDMEVVSRYKGPTPWGDDLADGFLPDLHLTEYLNGVYTLLFRSDLLGAPENAHILASLAGKIKAEPVWVASGRELADWWSGRSKIRVEARMITPTRIRMSVTNQGSADMKNASAYLYLPNHPRNLRVIPELLGTMHPNTQLLDSDDDVLRMDFPVLNRQSSYVCLIVLDEN